MSERPHMRPETEATETTEPQALTSEGSAPRRAERPDPRLRPPDPAGTRPRFDPDTLEPSGEFRALPPGEPASGAGGNHLPATVADASPPAPTSPQAQSPHTPRFQFMLGALGALGVAAIALCASFALRPAPRPTMPWSAWHPSSGGGDPAEQIAAHVAPEYVRAPGHQLVGVTGGPQAIGGQPVVVALRASGSSPSALPEDGVFYQLCGEGPSCSIPGKASLQRGLLVRREALELALYTFHYIGGASQVIVTFPPPPPAAGAKRAKGASTSAPASSASSPSSSSESASSSSATSKAPGRVLLFRPQDVEAELSKPLAATLSSVAPTVARIEAAPEARLVDQLTGKLLYDSTLIPQQQSGSAVLLLQPPSIGG